MNRQELFELLRLDPETIADPIEYWALYATSFYEKGFAKIDDPRRVEEVYQKMRRNPNFNKRAKDALTFFYMLRMDELENPDFWKQNEAEKIDKTMKAIFINEYYDAESDELSRAKMEARKISKEEGCAAHVNEIRPGVYRIEDWFDSDQTVASYENGNIIRESIHSTKSEDILSINDLAEIMARTQIEQKSARETFTSYLNNVYDKKGNNGVRKIFNQAVEGTGLSVKPFAPGKFILVREEVYESLNEATASIEDYEKLAIELEKRRIPCKIQLSEFGSRQTIDVLCGWDYPDKLADKVWQAMEASGVQAEVSADTSGGTIIKSQRIAGGPKRYNKW